MQIIYHITGNISRVIEKNKIDTANSVIKRIDEKMMAKPKFLKSLFKEADYSKVIFAVDDLSYQRFQTFMKMYILYFGSTNGEIIDELGNKNKFSIAKLFIKELPLLAIESIVSGLVVVFWYIYLTLIHSKIKKSI